jgi:hypothetical protein
MSEVERLKTVKSYSRVGRGRAKLLTGHRHHETCANAGAGGLIPRSAAVSKAPSSAS